MESVVVITSTILCFLLANLFVLVAAATSSPRNYNSSSTTTTTTDQLLECLIFQFHSSQSDIDQVIYTPQNPYYSSILKSSEQNLRSAGSTSKYQPLLIITPFHESEIQATIYCSKKHGVQIRVRSGGHDYEGLSFTSQVPNFMIVDMRNLRTISIDTKDNTLWVQSGATLGELYYAIGKVSKTLAFPAGVCPTVGVGGHFTGGGYGMISRKHGISVDNIIDAKLINVEGRRVLDRESMGEDLFWAVRGGGGTSFGIILAFKLKLSVVPEIVTVFNVTKTLEQNATQLVHKWQYISHEIDENLLLRLFFKSVVVGKQKQRGIAASFTCLFLGRPNDLLLIMQEKFPELGVAERDCVEMSWIESVLYFAGIPIDEPVDVLLQRDYSKIYLKGKSDYVTQPIPEYGLNGLWKFLNEEEEEDAAQVQFSPCGGILSRIPESETPFPHRSGNIYMIHYSAYWFTGEPAVSERHVNWIRRLYDYMTPFVSNSPRAAYFNYKDLDIGMNNNNNIARGNNNIISYKEASVWGFKYFKNNFDRLVRVKTKVDPNNFFRNEQSIPPLSSDESPTIRLNVDDDNDSVLL